MVERVRAGQYEIGSKEPQNNREGYKTMGVIKGEAVNDIGFGPFGKFMSVTTSKWFGYEIEELRVKQRNVTTGTYLRSIASLDFECDTKKEAVSKAKSWYNL